MAGLAAADGDHNFQLIAGLEFGLVVEAFGDDFPIALDGNALAGQLKLKHQAGTA